MRHLINLRSLIKCTSTSKQSLMRLCCISPAYNAALVWCGREAVEQAGLSRRGRLSRVLHSRSHCRPLCCSSPPSTLFSFTTCWGSFFLVLKYDCHFEFLSQVMSVGPMFAFLPQNIVQLDKLLSRLVCTGLLSNRGTLWLELDLLPDQSVTNIQISSDINIIGSKNIHFFDVEWVMEVLFI